MKKLIIYFFLGAASIWANSSGAPTGTAGAPGDDNCAICHNGAVNSGAGRVAVSLASGTTYTPGQTVRLRITLEDPSAARWGFNLTVRREASNDFPGSFAIPSGQSPALVQIRNQGTARYVTHSANTGSTFRGQRNTATWEVDWTAPAAGTGPVRFYVAGNAANNNGSTGGDLIYTSNLSVGEASSTPPPAVTAGNTVLSQFVFGGGWTSWLYFTNNTAAQVSFPVNFFNDNAAPMPFGGTATRQLIIPSRGSVLVQAQNTGPLSQGWATWDMPTGVTGYGVFRQASTGPGVTDQEAVVPFASSTGTRASLTYDDSNLVTAVAIWYNGGTQGTITITARDESGAQIGTATLTMQPGTKQAFALAEKVPAAALKRGLVEFTASTGNIAVLGLRFAGSAFTSIPAAP